MKRKIKQMMLVVGSLLAMTLPAIGASQVIQYAADGASGEYCGVGYGVSVTVSTPSTGATVKYSETGVDGTWVDAPIAFKDVCTDKPIYFQISAAGYTTVVDSRTVTIMPKDIADLIWLALPSDDYVYDGTAKCPEVAFGDGEPSIMTEGDFEVSYANNINAGTATATFTGKGNYTGTSTEDFEIFKADNAWTTEPSIADWTYAQVASEPVSAAKNGTATVTYGTVGNPSSLGASRPTMPGEYVATFTVAESENYKALSREVSFKVLPATINYAAEGSSGTYCGTSFGVSITVATPSSGATIKYSETGADGTWVDEPITFKNVCTDKPIYFQISAEGYATVVDSRTVTVTPKDIADLIWLALPSDDYVYDGTAKCPEVAFGDGEPSIMTVTDFEVSYANNINAGTATATFAGKGNYTGTVTEDFEIYKADNEWTTEPSIADWTYAQAPSEPMSAAKNGTATVTYGTVGNPGSLGASRPTMPGEYVATFTVAESQNYKTLLRDVPFKILPATINYAAEGSSGTYCGTGFGVSITVATPSSGATIKYSETGADGTWIDEPITFKNVCTDKPIYFQISAEGYTTVTDSRTVTITPKDIADFIWLVLPSEGYYVYDGTEKHPEVAFADGEPSIMTGSDFEVSYANNINAGTATATFTGKGNYTGTATEDFEILKAKINGGEEPGSGSVAAGGVSKFDASFEYDGKGHTVDAAAILAAYETAVIGGVDGCKYALSATSDAWLDIPPSFTNVCVTSVWYKVSAVNYDDFVHEVRLTINPRDIANVTIEAIADVTFENNPITPTPVVTDGAPSIITADDYTVSYLNNAAPGMATVVLTGKGNYTGEKSINFTIKEAEILYAALKGELVWKLNMGSGCYTAQLKLTCTNGFNQGISDLKFIYQDRMNGAKITSGLWDSSKKAYRPTTTIGGTTYRYVSLDASKITAQDVTALYGVQDVTVAVGVVPAAQCNVELFVGNLASPVSDLGYVMWKSNGAQCMLPISAAGGSQGMEVSPAMLNTMRVARSASTLASPLSTSALNTSLALGVVLDSASSPYCKLTDFKVTENGLTGRVEVGKDAGGVETKGALGVNARVVLMGAKDLSEGFSEIGNVPVDECGTFTFHLGSKDYRFFKVRIDIQNVVE